MKKLVKLLKNNDPYKKLSEKDEEFFEHVLHRVKAHAMHEIKTPFYKTKLFYGFSSFAAGMAIVLIISILNIKKPDSHLNINTNNSMPAISINTGIAETIAIEHYDLVAAATAGSKSAENELYKNIYFTLKAEENSYSQPSSYDNEYINDAEYLYNTYTDMETGNNISEDLRTEVAINSSTNVNLSERALAYKEYILYKNY